MLSVTFRRACWFENVDFDNCIPLASMKCLFFKLLLSKCCYQDIAKVKLAIKSVFSKMSSTTFEDNGFRLFKPLRLFATFFTALRFGQKQQKKKFQ